MRCGAKTRGWRGLGRRTDHGSVALAIVPAPLCTTKTTQFEGVRCFSTAHHGHALVHTTAARARRGRGGGPRCGPPQRSPVHWRRCDPSPQRSLPCSHARRSILRVGGRRGRGGGGAWGHRGGLVTTPAWRLTTRARPAHAPRHHSAPCSRRAALRWAFSTGSLGTATSAPRPKPHLPRDLASICRLSPPPPPRTTASTTADTIPDGSRANTDRPSALHDCPPA